MKRRISIILSVLSIFIVGSLIFSEKTKALIPETIDPMNVHDFGSVVDVCKGRTIEFPWWLVIFIALCDAVIIRILYPIQKKCKKLHKKVLTKPFKFDKLK